MYVQPQILIMIYGKWQLHDTELLARISGGDLVARESKYHFNCLSAYKSIGVFNELNPIIT